MLVSESKVDAIKNDLLLTPNLTIDSALFSLKTTKRPSTRRGSFMLYLLLINYFLFIFFFLYLNVQSFPLSLAVWANWNYLHSSCYSYNLCWCGCG